MQFALKPTSRAAVNKLLGLEVLRFLTAFAILVYHYQHFSFVADKPVDLVQEHLPLHGLLHVFYRFGASGVWIFWGISGFIFFWKYRDAIADQSVGGWKFFVLRFSRLYPLHLVTLLLVAMLQPVYFALNGYFFVYQENDLRHFLLQLFMILQSGNSFNAPIWSILVEVLVYFLFFLMLRATKSWLLNLVIVVACAQLDGEIAACFAFFYIGGLAAIVRRAVASVPSRFAVETGAWLAAVLLPPIAWIFARDQLEPLKLQLMLTYTPILLFCLSRDITVPASIQKAVEAAGNMTYSSYLLHFPIQLAIVLGFAILGSPIPLYDVTFFGVYIATTLLASYFTYRYFEAPAQNLIRQSLIRDALLRPAVAAVRPTALSITK
jgi:peptidoglycan/LPS O-acetylase OafA/YrhL